MRKYLSSDLRGDTLHVQEVSLDPNFALGERRKHWLAPRGFRSLSVFWFPSILSPKLCSPPPKNDVNTYGGILMAPGVWILIVNPKIAKLLMLDSVASGYLSWRVLLAFSLDQEGPKQGLQLWPLGG